MLSIWLTFSLCFLSLWAQRGIPPQQGQSGRIMNIHTWIPLFSCFLLGPALNFSIIWDGWFFLFDFEVKVLVRLMCFHTARPLPQQLAVYLSVTLVKYLFWLWYFLLTMKQNKKIHPRNPTTQKSNKWKKEKKKKAFPHWLISSNILRY